MGVGHVKVQAQSSCSITSTRFYWSEQVRGGPDSQERERRGESQRTSGHIHSLHSQRPRDKGAGVTKLKIVEEKRRETSKFRYRHRVDKLKIRYQINIIRYCQSGDLVLSHDLVEERLSELENWPEENILDEAGRDKRMENKEQT